MIVTCSTELGAIDMDIPRRPGETEDDQFHRVAAAVRETLRIEPVPEMDPRDWAALLRRAHGRKS